MYQASTNLDIQVPAIFAFCRQRSAYGIEPLYLNSQFKYFLLNPNALVAISKGMQAVKLYSNIILQFLTWLLA